MIQGQRVSIIPFHRRFITSKYINWLNDPDVHRFSNQRAQVHTATSCLEYLDSYRNSGDMFWAIVEIDEGHGHIGNISAFIDKESQVADIGIVIGEKQLWGKGYGLEAWLAVCDYLFSNESILKITGGTVVTNEAMVSIFRKAGMREQSSSIGQELVGGELKDVVKFELLKWTN